MVSVKDVPADIYLKKLKEYIKKNIHEVKPPEWAKYVKTSAAREHPPEDPDWWYVRAASLLRKIYIHGPIGVSRLREFYGGRKNRGVKPERHYDGAAGNIRKILIQLEAAGLIMKTPKGRDLTRDGRSLMDRLAAEVKKEINITPWYEQYA
jgi:small subunit ribosomal protein S19e